MKTNCWNVKGCSHGPDAPLHARCPAARETRLDGVHDGRNAGRACWVIAGTMCGGKPCGTYAQKLDTCENCGFFKWVISEEYPHHLSTEELLDLLGRHR